MDPTNFPCQICLKEFKNKSSLTRHERAFHKLSSRQSLFNCNECSVSLTSLALISKHCETDHGSRVAKFCIYCNTVFISLQSYFNHVHEMHGLPPSVLSQSCVQPSASACSGALNVYNLPIDDQEVDLLHYMISQRTTIFEIISQNVRNNAYKVQFSAVVSLIKPDGNDEKHLDVFLNTNMVPVFFDGLSDENFLDMAQQMISTLNVFATYGSGWIVEKIRKFAMNMGRFSPIRGSRYVALPPHLDNDQALQTFGTWVTTIASYIVSSPSFI